jgi:dihydrofolate synthase/folylpolyglutamate synthase
MLLDGGYLRKENSVLDYREALAYIYSFSDYERGSKYSRDRNENLLRETALLELLSNPHQQYTNTLIAGTKGKGSTAAYIERVLREAGVRTGLYTQPDLHTFRERIQVNGRLISEEEVGALIPEIRVATEQIQARQQFEPFITYEIGTALAFLYFAHKHVQHAVIEVGIGGRLDATNVTHPLVSVIASISYDHTHILGNTLAKIATEKAGIIKPGGLVVTSAQSPEALLAIATIAKQREAQLIRIGSADGDPAQAEVDVRQLPPLNYRYRTHWQRQHSQSFTVWTPNQVYENLETPLLGVHQAENATLALATLELLRERGYAWDEEALRRGMKAVQWPARIQLIGHDPTIVVDGAHNTDSMHKLLQTLRSTFSPHHLIIVLSVNRDKDLVGIVQTLRDVDSVVLTRIKNPRVAHIEEIESLFAKYAPNVIVHRADTTEEAMDLALDLAERSDLICATGSLYLAGEALRWGADHGDQIAASQIAGVDH